MDTVLNCSLNSRLGQNILNENLNLQAFPHLIMQVVIQTSLEDIFFCGKHGTYSVQIELDRRKIHTVMGYIFFNLKKHFS